MQQLTKLFSADTLVKMVIYLIIAIVGYVNLSSDVKNHAASLIEIKDEMKIEFKDLHREVSEIKIDVATIKQQQKDEHRNDN